MALAVQAHTGVRGPARRAVLVGIGIIALVTGTTHAAFATVTSTVSLGSLVITSDAGDTIAVTCAAGNVQVNLADPGTGPALCSGIVRIAVTGDAGANTIDLSGVTTADFTTLAKVHIDGGAGNDVITGSAIRDHIDAGAGNDSVTGGAGKDYITGGAGDDTIDGGANVDTLLERGNVDFTLTDASLTGNGTDGLTSVEIVRLYGGVANNTIDATGFSGSTFLYGGLGDDVLTGGSGNDGIHGGDGNDQLTGGGGSDTLRGDTGADTLNATDTVSGNDVADGGAGTDTCTADAGDLVTNCEL